MLELDRTKIALENATNQLMALQHKQFVEQRVYDDDETLANVDNVPTEQPEQVRDTFQPQLLIDDIHYYEGNSTIECFMLFRSQRSHPLKLFGMPF